ncbi:dipeptide/oligopeptide/nickel ABC transporter permease/ATP-binding protein [Paeniglutamicibacter gangotriensis]|uniref:Dipeptide/oligopeptide/nickel ABC transporter permease/ATP-binding protein n=1 Tax=Paeniglutamicibacter gangotriensis TaxID=254787 RepID=A0A5B0E490_9MICC|nr:ABC transporter permease subunit [Paeniglutamicibacter gangotriensis]KAA0973152.1 dipeptide/oligopeptide/nickel ABC transporter permease/ATP-binding protein [Paeniglutamicibacter gangotriensis]
MFKPRLVPLVLLGLALAYAVLVPWLQPLDPRAVDLSAVLQVPSSEHFFGTDQLGRDVWIRSAQGLRMSLLLALLASVFSTVLGVGVGLLAAWRGGTVDRIAMRLVDVTNALPHLLLAVVIVALWRGQWWAIVLSIALTHWTQVARIVRSRLLAERTADYVQLARASGAPTAAIWCTHLIPAVAPQAAIALVLQLPHAIWHESALSFLGVGLPPESASLGLLLEDARGGLLAGAWWLLVFPAGLLVLVSWSTASMVDTAGPGRRRGPIPRLLSGLFTKGRGPLPAAGAARVDPSVRQSPAPAAIQSSNLDVFLPSTTGTDTPSRLLRGVDYRAEAGAINVILGASGAGKSLLLRTLTGLLPLGAGFTGNISINGRSRDTAGLAEARGQETVLVPGSAGTALNPVRTVAAQMQQTLKAARRPASRADVLQALRDVAIDESLAHSYPHELSGGQAQRVALGLGVAVGSRILLVDEPTSALDAETIGRMETLLLARAAAGVTIIMITHDLELARRIADYVTVLQEGRVIESGTATDVLGDPAPPATGVRLGVPL